MAQVNSPARRDEREPFPLIIGTDGRTYVDPLGDDKYLVRHYSPPSEKSLGTYLQLVRDFERRFLNYVDRGYSVLNKNDGDLDHDIMKWRTESQDANAPLGEDQRDYAARMLRVALLGRAMRGAKSHIKMRLQGHSVEEPALQTLATQVEADIVETLSLPPLRMKRGYKDVDDIVGEMIGEPQKIFFASLSGITDNIREFYAARYRKVAAAMQSIDMIHDAIEPVGKRFAGIPALLTEMKDSARIKIQLQHYDPDFDLADKRYNISRNKLHDFVADRQEEITQTGGGWQAQTNLRALALLKDATDLIYDITTTHSARHKGARLLEVAVEKAGLGAQQNAMAK